MTVVGVQVYSIVIEKIILPSNIAPVTVPDWLKHIMVRAVLIRHYHSMLITATLRAVNDTTFVPGMRSIRKY